MPRHETLRIRGLDIHLTRWGPEPSGADLPVFLLHGWQDTGATFQFMVDAFERDWPLVALDWRGFGGSEWAQDGYWFPDYFADLEALLGQLSLGAPARIVGHSMGGNIATQYAGLRPDRVRCVASLEGFGLPRSSPEKAPVQLRKWLDQVTAAPTIKDYDSLERLAAVIQFRYPRITPAQAGFVAAAWSKLDAGRVRLLGDSRHRWVNPVRYEREDAEACWREIKAPLLMVLGDESEYLRNLGADGSDAAFRNIIPHIEIVRIASAGHMLHIEKADLVARLVENFLSTH
ncbi:MAG TPA: alpha/beta hydrolase [Steroidobacteraceae bacterium]|nr:alpha/beta hydrolase [Steroidobacteraceae bacterium]